MEFITKIRDSRAFLPVFHQKKCKHCDRNFIFGDSNGNFIFGDSMRKAE